METVENSTGSYLKQANPPRKYGYGIAKNLMELLVDNRKKVRHLKKP